MVCRLAEGGGDRFTTRWQCSSCPNILQLSFVWMRQEVAGYSYCGQSSVHHWGEFSFRLDLHTDPLTSLMAPVLCCWTFIQCFKNAFPLGIFQLVRTWLTTRGPKSSTQLQCGCCWKLFLSLLNVQTSGWNCMFCVFLLQFSTKITYYFLFAIILFLIWMWYWVVSLDGLSGCNSLYRDFVFPWRKIYIHIHKMFQLWFEFSIFKPLLKCKE